MNTDQRIIYVANCQTILAKIHDFSSPNSKVEYGSKDKLAFVTDKHIHIYNSLVSYDAEEYRIADSSPSKVLEKPPPSIDLTEPPFSTLDYLEKEVFSAEGTQKIKHLFKDYPNLQVQNYTPTVFLVDGVRKKIDIIFFPRKRERDLFVRALAVGRGVNSYLLSAEKKGIKPNKAILRHVESLVAEENAYAVVDPEHFKTENEELVEVDLCVFLFNQAKCVHKLKFGYQLLNSHSILVLERFTTSELRNTLRFMSLSDTKLSDDFLGRVVHSIIRADKILDLDLSGNKLTDRSFMDLSLIVQNCKFVKRICLNKNFVTLDQEGVEKGFVQLLKQANEKLILELAHNQINDHAIEFIERAVIAAEGLPLLQLDLSFNRFTSFGIWRMSCGHQTYGPRFHQDFNLILGPYPLNKHFIDLQLRGTSKHSVEQNERQVAALTSRSLDGVAENRSLRVIRKKYSQKPLPGSKKDVQIVLKIKDQYKQLISKNQTIQSFLRLCDQIGEYPFETPMVSLKQLYQYLWARINEALLVRDHYSVQVIKKCAKSIGLELEHFGERFDILEERKEKIIGRIEKLLNFVVSEQVINQELDELCMECLRLDLKGEMIEFLFLLKKKRDEAVDSLLAQGVTAEDILLEGREQNVSQLIAECNKSEIFPRELVDEQKLNLAWYSRWMSADFIYLSEFQFTLDNMSYLRDVLRRLSKKKELVAFTSLIVDRINFLQSEFVGTEIAIWRKMFHEKKINPARLVRFFLSKSNFTTYFDPLQLKVPVSKEILLPQSVQDFFRQEKERPAKFKFLRSGLDERSIYGNYDYLYEMTKSYITLYEEFKPELIQFLEMALHHVEEGFNRKFLDILHMVNGCKRKDILLTEFYLHLIYFSRDDLPRLLQDAVPLLTGYLPVPKDLYSHFLFFILSLPYQFRTTAFSLNLNWILQCTGKIPQNPLDYISRDWVPRASTLTYLFRTFGRCMVSFDFEFKTYSIPVAESCVVRQLMLQMFSQDPLKSKRDYAHFWLFKIGNKGEIPFLPEDHVGELLAGFEEGEALILRRRIFSPYYKYKLSVLEKEELKEVFIEAKRDFLLGRFSLDDETLASAILHVINYFQKYNTLTINKSSLSNCVRDLENMTEQCLTRFPGRRQRKDFLNQVRIKLQQIRLDGELIELQLCKRKFLNLLKEQPTFMASTVYCKVRETQELVKLSASFWGLRLSSLQAVVIDYVSLLRMHVNSDCLCLRFMENGKLRDLELVINKLNAHEIMQDVLAYCRMQLAYPTDVLIRILHGIYEVKAGEKPVLFGLGTVVSLASPFIKEQFWVERNKPRSKKLQLFSKKQFQAPDSVDQGDKRLNQQFTFEEQSPEQSATVKKRKNQEAPTPLSEYQAILIEDKKVFDQLKLEDVKQEQPLNESLSRIMGLYANPDKDESWMEQLLVKQDKEVDDEFSQRRATIKKRISQS